MPSSYRGDPFRMTAKYAGPCGCCKHRDDPSPHTIGKGDSIFYYPRTKTAYVGPCADAAERDFNSAVAAEDFYNGGSY